ncbi:MAG: DNA-3-methyladenine glycosylase [Chitinophagaceae bacterium]|nr:DNA-3-methyladenine glycosylase [Chitinophagaceae bacterium]
MKKLGKSFYERDNVVQIARELPGKFLMTKIDGIITGGMITEVEAYEGVTDRASHAFNNRRTARTEVMYSAGGTAYVYLCYGIHHLFNVVTNKSGIPHAILIRAIEPAVGIDLMMKRRKKSRLDFTLTSGPGALSEALGIQTQHTGKSLLTGNIWLEDRGIEITQAMITKTTRIGVDYAGTDALLPYRFYIKGNKWVSRKMKGL